MIYVGFQVMPVPGKYEQLKSCYDELREIAEANGAHEVGGFEVAIGQAPGSLVYIVAYADAETYVAATKALSESAAWREARPFVASSTSSVLQPLHHSPIQ